jgi:hydrogenase small subunit
LRHFRITRRQFLQALGASAAALGLSATQLEKYAEMIMANDSGLKILWLSGQACTGCLMPFLDIYQPWDSADTYSTQYTGDTEATAALGTLGIYADLDHIDIADVLIDVIDLEYQSTAMAPIGEQAAAVIQEYRTGSPGTFVLALDGSVPTASNGEYCMISKTITNDGTDPTDVTLTAALTDICTNNDGSSNYYCGAAVAVGACASFGNIPAAKRESTHTVSGTTYTVADPQATDLKTYLDANSLGMTRSGATYTNPLTGNGALPTIRIPTCPAHGDRLLGVVLLAVQWANDSNPPNFFNNTVLPSLDAWARPTMFYDRTVHSECVRLPKFGQGNFSSRLGQDGCLYYLGCKGPTTYADCPRATRSPDNSTWGDGVDVGSYKVWRYGWNNSEGLSCTAFHPCVGCAEKGFPDRFSPFIDY